MLQCRVSETKQITVFVAILCTLLNGRFFIEASSCCPAKNC